MPRASVNVSARRLRDENLIKSLKKLDIEPGHDLASSWSSPSISTRATTSSP